MPRSTSALKHSGRKTTSTTWRTAAIAPPRPKDLETKMFDLPRGPWTPAELVLNVLEEGLGRGWGEDGPDTRPNVELKFSVDVTTVEEEEDCWFQEPPTYHCKLTVAPVLFIRPVTVELDSWTGDDVEAPGAPLWLRSMVQTNGVVREQKFVRFYLWVYCFVVALLGTPDLVIPHYDSWIKVLNVVDHIKGLYDAGARPRPKHPIRPRPVQRIKTLADALARLDISDVGATQAEGALGGGSMGMD